MLNERCKYFKHIFDLLQSTNSILIKRRIIDEIKIEYKDDFEYIVEILTGKYVFGYSYWPSSKYPTELTIGGFTIKQVLEYLQEPYKNHNLSMDNITKYVHATAPWGWFLEPIVNRTLKLGIGKSILPKEGFAPMLAKKYEGKIKYDDKGYIITEKLDGNRCIAIYDVDHWVFRSRNGKIMHVNFDMGDLPKEFVYDGEVMSKNQTEASIRLHRRIADGDNNDLKVYSDDFNTTSGIINRHTINKDIVYNIFDIMMDDVPYLERRVELSLIRRSYRIGDDVRILPTLIMTSYLNLESISNHFLHLVTSMGGEGIMINLANSEYHHKRTDQLLKLKNVQTIDMKVYDFDYGTGKYEGMIGALKAKCVTDDGKIIKCDIGSGLSDDQRLQWTLDFSKICGKIVEVAYFSLSQTSAEKGSNHYSLRFPRLKSVRKDKIETSEY